MNKNKMKPLLNIGNIRNYYDFYKFNYLFYVETLPEYRKKKLKDNGLDFDKVKKCCSYYGIREQEHGFLMGIVHLFFVGYHSAQWSELEYKPNSNRLKEQMEQIKNLDIDQIMEIVIKTKLETIKLDKGLTTFTIIAALREMKEDFQPGKMELFGNRSYYKNYVYTDLMPFYQFLIDQNFFDTKVETVKFIIDLCECFNLEWEQKFKISDPADYLKDRFKEKA